MPRAVPLPVLVLILGLAVVAAALSGGAPGDEPVAGRGARPYGGTLAAVTLTGADGAVTSLAEVHLP
jgi:hypothetical protein